MKRIGPEKEINYISIVIEKNIDAYANLKDKGLLSQNILSQLRNLVEDIAILITNKDNNTEYDSHYLNVEPSMQYIKGIAKYKYIYDFHSYLQSTASHYTPNDDGAQRLVFHYYRYMCMLKNTLKEDFNIDIIKNIEDFPIYEDSSMKEQYDLVCSKINEVDLKTNKYFKDGRFYVQKVTPLYSKGELYYEITLSKATDYINKFERITMYSKMYIPDNYSIKLSYIEKEVKMIYTNVKIKVIDNYLVSIRICELQNLGKIVGMNLKISDSIEYQNLMRYLTDNKITITRILELSKEEYSEFKQYLMEKAKNNKLSGLLDNLRKVIINKEKGSNLLRYLTTKLENTVLRDQLDDSYNNVFTNLYFKKYSAPFDTMPYAMSLCKHNASWYHLIESIDMNGREHELLGRIIKNNSENNNILYTSVKDLEDIGDIKELIDKYNYILVNKKIDVNGNNVLVNEHNDIYLKSYEENSKKIIYKLNEYLNIGIKEITDLIDVWLAFDLVPDISSDKVDILNDILRKDSIAIIHGPAGTGKTKMLEILAEIFSSYDKVFLANTNTAKDNLDRRILSDNSSCMTIAKYINNNTISCDILFIDECSTVSNADMVKILEKQKYKIIILSGDIYQIESIKYGNWFQLCNMYYKDKIVYNLSDTHRTNDVDLLELWSLVRNDDKNAICKLNSQEYSHILDNDIFSKKDKDEIILCLNYDGIYGINNINKIMQTANPNSEFNIGVDTFKIEDPVLFNDCPRFQNYLYNNLKGIIKKIVEEEEHVWFTIQIDDIDFQDIFIPPYLQIFESEEMNKINVRFKVNKFKDRDDDENVYDHIIPFNLAYAVSIHKAQGLEYESVKIVITANVEDNITKNIFYTAITRAKKYLKIYWSPDSQTKIFNNFEKKNNSRDISILKSKIK